MYFPNTMFSLFIFLVRVSIVVADVESPSKVIFSLFIFIFSKSLYIFFIVLYIFLLSSFLGRIV